ncbi:MAG: TlpA family protein disulfide reductase [Acidobacteriota bacterium]
MANSRRQAEGSMAPFWVVVGLAALVLVVYLLFGKGGGPAPALSARRGAVLVPPALEEASGGPPLVPASLRGKVVVLHFWATWCPPCREEFPAFARYAEEARRKGDAEVVAVSLDQTADPVPAFVRKAGGSFPVYMDDGAFSSSAGVSVIPTTVVLDRQGRVALRQEGAARWDGSGIPAAVRKLAAE